MTAQITAAAKKIVEEVADTVKQQFNIEVPQITYRTSGRMTRAWGRAIVEYPKVPSMTKYYIVLSSVVYNETNVNSESFRKVVIHELAHLLDFAIYKRMSDHGFTWSQIMKKLNETPTRYVTKAEKEEINHVPAPKRKMTRYSHDCSSPKCTVKHYVGGQIHNKIMRGVTYTCNHCGTKLVKSFTEVKV
jgi:predicted SprT family Zn-dependent metalloprotease